MYNMKGGDDMIHFNLRFLNNLWDYKRFRVIDWIGVLLPISPRFSIRSSDDWDWISFHLELWIPFHFRFEILGYSININIPETHFINNYWINRMLPPLKKIGIEFRNNRKSTHWDKESQTMKEEVFSHVATLRGITLELSIAEGWDLFYLDIDIYERFGGIILLFFHLGW